ncbi:hypothetical protein PCYB_006570, partial [Plasmodium cynomolgi strain B]
DKIYSLVQDKSEFSRIIIMIYHELIYNNPGKYKVCDRVYYIIDKDIFNKYKLLFDYSKDYEKIKHHTLDPNTTCDQKYKEVLENYIDTYIHAYSNCIGARTTKYDCNYFHNLFKESFENLTTSTCRDRQNDEAILETDTTHRDKRPALKSDLPSSKYGGSYRYEFAPENTKTSLATQYKSDGSLSLPMEDSTGGSSSRTTIGLVVPVLGVSFISFLLYR